MSSEFDGDEARWAELMAAALRGERHPYEQLLRELAEVTEAYVRRRFGALSFTEDVVQECLLAIHAARHTYDPGRPFRPWFFTIVRNKTIDLLRRSYAGRAARESMPEALPMPQSAENPEFEAVVVGELLERLEPKFASALTLTKVYGYSLAEAAARTGISESAMKSRVSRAVRAASNLLERE